MNLQMSQVKQMTEYWDKRNRTILSTVGHWVGGSDVAVENYSLMNDLMGKASLMQLNVLNATGKLINKNVADWIEINFMGLSYPDSRIWCNQVSSYVADCDSSVVAAASAAILSADSRAYGGSQTTQSSMQFLQDGYRDFENGSTIAEVVSKARVINDKPMIVGFARPIDRDDERLKPYQAIQKQLDIPQGKYLDFALQLSTYLDAHYSLSINSGGYASAFLLDQGFSPEDGYKIKAFSVIGGAVACYRNMETSPPNSFLPQKCTDIEYKGKEKRKL